METFRSVLTENQINESARDKLTLSSEGDDFKYYIKPGIYKVTDSFAIRFGVTATHAKKGDLLKIEDNLFGEGNVIKKWDPVSKEWKIWKNNKWNYRYSDIEKAYLTIANNVDWVAASENSKKVQELMTPSALVFNSPRQAIEYLETLPKRSKIRIEVQ